MITFPGWAERSPNVQLSLLISAATLWRFRLDQNQTVIYRECVRSYECVCLCVCELGQCNQLIPYNNKPYFSVRVAGRAQTACPLATMCSCVSVKTYLYWTTCSTQSIGIPHMCDTNRNILRINRWSGVDAKELLCFIWLLFLHSSTNSIVHSSRFSPSRVLATVTKGENTSAEKKVPAAELEHGLFKTCSTKAAVYLMSGGSSWMHSKPSHTHTHTHTRVHVSENAFTAQ